RAYAAYFGGKNKARTQKRHGDTSEVQVKLDAPADKERTRQKLANLPAPNCEIHRHSTGGDDCRDEDRNGHADFGNVTTNDATRPALFADGDTLTILLDPFRMTSRRAGSQPSQFFSFTQRV